MSNMSSFLNYSTNIAIVHDNHDEKCKFWEQLNAIESFKFCWSFVLDIINVPIPPF